MMNSSRHEDDAWRVYGSLKEALASCHVPVENHALIHQFCKYVGIDRYEERAGYIKAIRTDGSPALNISSGYTNGFVSEDEAHVAVGDAAAVWRSNRGTGLWGVSHPINSIRDSGGEGRRRGPAEVPDICPKCFLQLPATKICGSCG